MYVHLKKNIPMVSIIFQCPMMSVMIHPKSFIIFHNRSIVKSALDMFILFELLLKQLCTTQKVVKMVLTYHN